MAKKINSKAKGSDYERKIAKLLSDWFGEEFHRVPASGGLRWGTDNRVVGDITTSPDSKFPFTVECKKREGWDFEQVLKGTGEVEQWWEQSSRDGERASLLPIVIFSKNFAPNYLMMEQEVFDKILYHKGQKSNPFNYFVVCKPGVKQRIICNLKDFTTFATKDDIINSLVD